MVLKNSGEKEITYSQVEAGVDLRYETLANGLKEEIILHQPREKSEDAHVFTFDSTFAGAYPKEIVAGFAAPVFYDTNNQYLFHFEKPFAVDATGNRTDDVLLQIEDKTSSKIPELRKSAQEEMSYTIRLVVNDAWLNDPARTYPITIDPTIIHDESSEFALGDFNRTKDTGSGATPLIETYYQEAIIDPQTVALWHFNEITNGTCAGGGDACDSSTNNIQGARTGTTITDGIFGKARSFNGSSDSINMGNNASLPRSGNFTIEAWVKTQATVDQAIITHGTSGDWLYWLGPTPGGALLCKIYQAASGSEYLQTTSVATINDNKWHHVACSVSDTTVTIYIDGKLAGIDSTPTGTRDVATAGNFYVGKFDWSSTYEFNGLIDEVRVSNVARTTDEIQAAASRRPYSIYTSPVIDLTEVNSWNSLSWNELGAATGNGETLKDSSDLVAQWNFNGNSGTSAVTSAGSCGGTCNGTLASFASTGGQDVAVGSGWTSNNRRWGAGAIMFDGTNDTVSVPNTSSIDFNYNQNFTVATWVKIPHGQVNTTNTQNEIIFKYDGVQTRYPYVFRVNNQTHAAPGKIVALRWDGTNVPTITSTRTVNDDQWHHLVFSKDGPILSLYIDGKLEGTTTDTTTTTTTNSSNLYFGSRAATAFWFSGSIDSTAIFSRAMSWAEVLSNYNAANIEFQTRVGENTSPNGGTWEVWRPTTLETLLDGYNQVRQYNTTDSNLVAYFSFDETTGSTIADHVGSNSLTASGSKVVRGRFNRARSLNGTVSDYAIKNPVSSFPTSAITVEMWVKSSNLTKNGALFSYAASTDNDFLIYNSQNLAIYRGAAVGGSTGMSVNDGRWHHIAATWQGSSGVTRLYKDGLLAWEGMLAPGTSLTGGGSLVIGQEQDSVGGGFDATQAFMGEVDEVRIYNAVLTASQIQARYIQGSSNPNLITQASDTVTTVEGGAAQKIVAGSIGADADHIALWRMEETGGTGAYIKDGSGNNYHGTPTGATVVKGISGNARSFNGSSNYIDMGDIAAIDTVTAMSACAWVYHSSASADHEIMAKGNGATDDLLFFRDDVGTSSPRTDIYTIYVADSADTDSARIESAQDAGVAGRWNHVCFSFNATSATGLRLYVNGRQDANSPVSVATIGAIDGGTNPFRIGSTSQGGAFFHGMIDEVNVWNKIISADEVAELYRMGRDHHLYSGLSSTNLSGKSSLPFYVAADRPGSYLEATISESNYMGGQIDANTVGFWHLEENSSAAAPLRDSSFLNIHPGTPTGTTVVDGKVGKARSFNGTSDTVSIPNTALLDINGAGSTATIELWFNPSTLSPTWQNLLYKNSGVTDCSLTSCSDRQYAIFIHNTGYIHAVSTSTNNIGVAATGNASATGLIQVGKWHHAAVVIDSPNSIMRTYLNGKEVATVAYSNTGIRTGSGNVFLGAVAGNSTFFQGLIDEVRISNTARTPEEIRQAYEYGMGYRSHTVTIDFAARLDNSNTIADSNDTTFTIDATSYGLSQKGSKLFPGEKIIVRENFDGTEYIAQGTVTSVSEDTGAVTISSWDGGSTFPTGGFTIYADVFKWQREYFSLTQNTLDSHLTTINQFNLRLTDGNEGRTIWLDDLQTNTNYMTNPLGSSIDSSAEKKYFQYRTILHSRDTDISAQVGAITLDYEANSIPEVPDLDSPTNSASNQSIIPTFLTTTTDADGDYLRYKIELCTNVGMSANCQTFDQTSSQTGWSGQNAETSTAYTSGTQANYTLQAELNPNTTYYWRSYAVDMGGSNTWSQTQASPKSFVVRSSPLPASACYLQESILDDQILITWTDNASNENFYEVQRSVNGGGWAALQSGLAANTTSLLDTDVAPGNTYQYRIAPYFNGPVYASWCTANTLNLGIGLFSLEGLQLQGLSFN